MRKAIFFDIDGTIWDRKQWIPDSAREAFRRMKQQGHYLFICSGRTRVFIPDELLMPLGFEGVLAGCGTYGEFQKEVKFYHRIPLKEIQRVNEILRELGAAYILEGRHLLYLDEERFSEKSSFSREIKKALGQNVVRVTGNEENLEVSKFCVNYMDGFNKATGIQEICRMLNIAPEETYSFGDSTNDLDMLKYTAHSVAMGDGMQEAKNAAEYVTAPLAEDGIYQACRHYGLI